jgi:hypothetical protein
MNRIVVRPWPVNFIFFLFFVFLMFLFFLLSFSLCFKCSYCFLSVTHFVVSPSYHRWSPVLFKYLQEQLPTLALYFIIFNQGLFGMMVRLDFFKRNFVLFSNIPVNCVYVCVYVWWIKVCFVCPSVSGF